MWEINRQAMSATPDASGGGAAAGNFTGPSRLLMSEDGTTSTLSKFFGRKPKQESGLDCLTCAIFSASVTGNVGDKSVGARESAAPDAAGWVALLRRPSQVRPVCS